MPRRLTRPRALLAVLAATALVPAAPATADEVRDSGVADVARMRVSDNWQMRPSSNPVAGRDAVGLAVNPRNSRHMVAVYADWATLWCEAAVSFNGGQTWRRDRLKTPPGFVGPPCTVGAHLSNQVDGGIAFGRGNTVYATFASARTSPSGDQGKSVLVARSTDGGRNFGTAVVAISGGADADQGPDYVAPKLAVVAGRRGKSDRIVVAAGESELDADGREDENAVVTVSNDGGRTWSPRRIVDTKGNNIEISQPVIGRGGRLYLAWRERGPGRGPQRFSPEGTVVVGRSTNGGVTWAEERVAGVRGYVYEGPKIAPFLTAQSFTASTFPRLAADRRSGDVYLVYGNGGRPTVPGRARKADHFIHPDTDVWFQRSTDGAVSWSSPDRINDEITVPTEITQTRHPNVSVAPDGRVDIVWHDRRHWYRGCTHTHLPCLEARLGDTYYAFSRNGGRSFSEDRRVTDRSINNDVGYDYRFGTYWDYGPVSVPIGKSRVMVAWMDSRIGNVETDSQGIFLANVDLTPSRRIPEQSVRASTPSRLAVELSRQAYPAGGEAVLGGTFASRPWSRVVIVNEDDEGAALAAGMLARANIGPVLLAPAGGLPAHVKDELARLQPVGAYVVGSRRALSDRVVADLAATGIPSDQITRLAGTSRADTARLIARAADRRTAREREVGAPAFDAAILVDPRGPEAYTAAVLAAARRLPILYVGRDRLPSSTRSALAELDVTRVLVIGDEDTISDQTIRGLPKPQRLGGRTLENTSRAVLAESRRRALPGNTVFAATGRMDAALLGAAGARIGGVQLMAGRGTAASVLADLGMRYGVDRIVHVRSRSGR